MFIAWDFKIFVALIVLLIKPDETLIDYVIVLQPYIINALSSNLSPEFH